MSSLHPPQQQAESRVERPNSRTPWTVRDETDGASAPQQPNSSYQPRLQRSHRHLPKFRQHKGEVPTKEMGPEGSPAPRLKECAFVALRGGELNSRPGSLPCAGTRLAQTDYWQWFQHSTTVDYELTLRLAFYLASAVNALDHS